MVSESLVFFELMDSRSSRWARLREKGRLLRYASFQIETMWHDHHHHGEDFATKNTNGGGKGAPGRVLLP